MVYRDTKSETWEGAALAALSRRVLVKGAVASGVAAQCGGAAAGRPLSHIVQVRDLPWRAVAGALKRSLSVDYAFRHETALIKLGIAGKWKPRRTSEIFLLRGDIFLGSQALQRYGYAVSDHEIASRDGATFLAVEGAADRVHRIVDSLSVPWSNKEWIERDTQASDGSPHSFVKTLSEFTHLLAVLPSGPDSSARFALGVDVECLCLQGRGLLGGALEIAAGGYSIINAGDAFGPWSTDVGMVALVRFSGTPRAVPVATATPAGGTLTVRRMWDIERDSMP